MFTKDSNWIRGRNLAHLSSRFRLQLSQTCKYDLVFLKGFLHISSCTNEHDKSAQNNGRVLDDEKVILVRKSQSSVLHQEKSSILLCSSILGRFINEKLFFFIKNSFFICSFVLSIN